MGIISYIKNEIQVIRERDPAIKSSMEVLLYPSFKVILTVQSCTQAVSEETLFPGQMDVTEGCEKDWD